MSFARRSLLASLVFTAVAALADTTRTAATRLGRDLLRLVETPSSPSRSPNRDLREAARA